MTNDSRNMEPNASPSGNTGKSGVRRVNNMPMYILGAVLLAFLIIIMMVMSDRAAQQREQSEEANAQVGNSSVFAEELAGNMDGIVPPKPLDLPPEKPKELLVETDKLDAPPAPPYDDEAARIRMAKFQMLEEAVKSQTDVRYAPPRSTVSQATGMPNTREEMLARIAAVKQKIAEAGNSDPTEAYQARLAQIKTMNAGGGAAGSTGAPELLNVSSTSNSSDDRWELGSEVEVPRTPYVLRAGFVMPGTLISGINSELPGQIIAQVAQNVYDTATGKYLLVPQGTRLVGSYSNNVIYGQARVLVAWQRIVFPDGKALDLGEMPGADAAGYSGFNDQVNNHYLRIFGTAFLMSGITAGFALTQNNDNDSSDSQRTSDALSEALGQHLGEATSELISKNLSIAPTLEIRPGYRFNVVVTKDMVFSKPYRSFDY